MEFFPITPNELRSYLPSKEDREALCCAAQCADNANNTKESAAVWNLIDRLDMLESILNMIPKE